MENKQLNFNNIISLQDKTFKKREVTISAEGETYTLLIEQKFKETEIAELVGELVDRSNYARHMKYDFNVIGHIMILVIKHFTDLQFPVVKKGNIKKEYENEVKMLNALINLRLLDQIINHFDPKELEKINESFEKYKDSLKQLHDNVIAEQLKEDK